MKEKIDISIVYVEDDTDVRYKITEALNRRFIDVKTASNGEEGLELFRKYNPTVIVTDLEMPVMNGLEMIKKIRQESDSNKPIIVVTAYMDDEHYTNLADVYLYKPIIISELIEKIKDVSMHL